VLAAAPLDAATLRSRLGLHERAARNFFDALAAQGFLQRDAIGRYSNSPESAHFSRSSRPDYVGWIIETDAAAQAIDAAMGGTVTSA
jgi:DNA-binding IclR family transcriptional regulator